MNHHFAPDLLRGEVALITGGSSGIGLAIAKSLASCGSDVAIIGRSVKKLEQAADEIAATTGRNCTAMSCDVREDDAIEKVRQKLADAHGAITIVVNNAAANFLMNAERMTARALKTIVDIDLLGTFNVTHALVGGMIEAGHGVILNIVVPDAERGFPNYSHAGAAKAGIISFTRSWAREWGRFGIRVNALGPGPVPTEGVASNMLGLRSDKIQDAFSDCVGRIPLGRLGAVEDIAAAATFLCSPAASWITGISMNVDGGLNVA
jgi:NAD(P)-dependent dehydrogenase (short-subunit alcohol dehydrogenase family)